MPRWKLDIRLRIVSAERAGGALSVSSPPLPPPTDPGTRLALGVRFGSPAVVVSSDAGSAATRAARYPSSAGELQVCPAAAGAAGAAAELELSETLPLRRNQSDSSESKIGSRWSGAAPPAGGIVTWLPSEPTTALPTVGSTIAPGPEAAESPSPPRAGRRV